MLFYIFIALILAVIAWSLSAQLIDSAVLMQIYIAAAILSVGVIVIDMLGLLGEHQGDEGSGSDDLYSGDSDDGGLDIGDHADGIFDDGVFDDGSIDHASFDHAHMDLDSIRGDDAIGSLDPDDTTVHVSDDDNPMGYGPVLEAIRYLRMFVYFCLGFGLLGLAFLVTGRSAQSSLIFASLAGIGTVMLARVFYRFQPHDTGEELSDDDLLLEQATVLFPLSDKTMGKIRVSMGMEVREVYARSAHDGEKYGRGAVVRIIRIENGCALVEEI